MKNFMTKEKREALSNRLVLNFGVLLAGALIMLYIYNFVTAGYEIVTTNVVGIIAILAAIGAIVLFLLGKKKCPKIKNYSAALLGTFVAGAITYLPRFSFVKNLVPAFTVKIAIISVFLLMLLYFIVMAIVTGIILKTHPEAPNEKKAIHHKKKNKR